MKPSHLAVFLFSQMIFAPQILAQTGTVAKIMKGCRARVVWDARIAPPAANGLGAVVERNRLLAVFRILSSEKHSSMVQILDVLLPDLLSKKERVQLLEVDPSPAPTGQASMLVWSDRAGGSFQVDGRPAGKVPAKVVLEPGSHEIVLDLPEGGRAGAKVDTLPDEEDAICLHGRSWPSLEGDGLPVFLSLGGGFRKKPGKVAPLRWLEDRQGLRVYACCEPVKNPIAKRKVMPRFPELARRMGHEGRVTLDVLIGADGVVQHVDVLSSPDPEFAQAATEAAVQSNYEPATLDGKPVPVFFGLIVDFYLSR